MDELAFRIEELMRTGGENQYVWTRTGGEKPVCRKRCLAVLPTGFGKSRIYHAFSRFKSCENTSGTLLIIARLKRIIKDQLADLCLRGLQAAALSSLSQVELEECNLEIILYSAEEALTREFTSLLKRSSSKRCQRMCCNIVDKCHMVKTWTGII